MIKLDDIENIFLKNAIKTALIIDNEIITYKELLSKAKLLAANLSMECENNVIVYGHKEKYMIISFIACLLSNKTYIPVDISLPNERIKKIINDSNSKIIITEYANTFNLKKIVINNLNNSNIIKANNDIAYIMYTSGSTGNPKGVPISRSNLENFINWISNSYLKKYKKINVLNQANYNFDLSIADIYYSLFNGHTLVITNDNLFDNFDNLFRLIKDNNINLFVATPTFIRLLLINKDFISKNYSSIKCVYFCGEVLDVKLVKKFKERFNRIEIINAYGPTEATSAVSMVKITSKMLKKDKLPIGIINNSACNIKIEKNEIILVGKSVFGGYLNSNSKVKQYKTGDYGYIENNLLYFNGRKDDIIKYKGYRIDLNDIRLNILSLNNVEDVNVTASYNNSKIIYLSAYVAGKHINQEIIKNKLMDLLPDYMIPSKIIVLDKISFNENFKQRRCVR